MGRERRGIRGDIARLYPGGSLENLDEAVALFNGEIGRELTGEELRELGIDLANNVSGELDDPEMFE